MKFLSCSTERYCLHPSMKSALLIHKASYCMCNAAKPETEMKEETNKQVFGKNYSVQCGVGSRVFYKKGKFLDCFQFFTFNLENFGFLGTHGMRTQMKVLFSVHTQFLSCWSVTLVFSFFLYLCRKYNSVCKVCGKHFVNFSEKKAIKEKDFFNRCTCSCFYICSRRQVFKRKQLWKLNNCLFNGK